jgi:hypothetical protein
MRQLSKPRARLLKHGRSARRARWTMRLKICFILALLGACTRSIDPKPTISDNNDQMSQEIKRLIDDQSECWRKEVFSKSIANADLQTAAYAVVGKCVAETQRLKAWSAAHYPGSVFQFEQHWAEVEQRDLETVRQMIAVFRTSH